MFIALAGSALDVVNPTLPAAYDLAWALAPILMIALIAVSLVSIARHTDGLSSMATAVWSAIVIFATFLGPIAWFLIGRPAARTARLTSPIRTQRG